MRTNTELIAADLGGPVEVWTGQRGTLLYRTRDGYLGVRLDGEHRVDEWQSWQVADVRVAS